jgi:hypothetical protein
MTMIVDARFEKPGYDRWRGSPTGGNHALFQEPFVPLRILVERASMRHIHNGMSAAELTSVAWFKSRRSNPSGNCVELAMLPGGGTIAMRNSRHPAGPAQIYPLQEMADFLRAARNGEFDDLVA